MIPLLTNEGSSKSRKAAILFITEYLGLFWIPEANVGSHKPVGFWQAQVMYCEAGSTLSPTPRPLYAGLTTSMAM